MEDQLKNGLSSNPEQPEPNPREPWPLRALRSFSSYLTPNLDLLGGDKWSLIGAYVLNFLNNATIIYLLLALVLITPLTFLKFVYLATVNNTSLFWVALRPLYDGLCTNFSYWCTTDASTLHLIRPSNHTVLMSLSALVSIV